MGIRIRVYQSFRRGVDSRITFLCRTCYATCCICRLPAAPDIPFFSSPDPVTNIKRVQDIRCIICQICCFVWKWRRWRIAGSNVIHLLTVGLHLIDDRGLILPDPMLVVIPALLENMIECDMGGHEPSIHWIKAVLGLGFQSAEIAGHKCINSILAIRGLKSIGCNRVNLYTTHV